MKKIRNTKVLRQWQAMKRGEGVTLTFLDICSVADTLGVDVPAYLSNLVVVRALDDITAKNNEDRIKRFLEKLAKTEEQRYGKRAVR